MPTVRTRTSTDAARIPGISSGARTRAKTCQVRAPHIRAAASTFGSICSMNGVIVRITNGIAGTRLTRITPVSELAMWYVYSTVASGMPYAIGGTITGSRKTSITSRLSGNCRRASTYAAGTPASAEMTTTDSDTWSVTISTLPMSKSCHALCQYSTVRPAGHQVPNHWVENESTTTEKTTPARLTKKNASTAQITQTKIGRASCR